MPQPLAFLSYTRKDDEFFGGYITAFRKTLENAVHVVSGKETFKVFQDVEGIVIGENWKKKLNDVIHGSSFFVPMLSPLFFNSKPCIEEVEEFLEHERTLNRDDLILPVYFLVTAKLEKKEEREKDPIAKELATRQMFDWRENAKLPLQEPAAREAILELAREIAAATERLEECDLGHGATTDESPRHEGGRAALAADPRLGADPRLNAGVTGDIRRNELSPRKILWVDDSPDNNVWERSAFESYGFRFTLARDTDQARRLLSEDPSFAAVISDMGRPGDRSAGLTLLKWLRESSRHDTPYFIYTSSRGAKRRPAAGDPQAHGVTADPDALVEMVVSSLR
jgi:CheY-like chemotaxis protein